MAKVLIVVLLCLMSGMSAYGDPDSNIKKESQDRIEYLNRKARERDQQMQRDKILQKELEIREREKRELAQMSKERLVGLVMKLKTSRPGDEYNNVFKMKNDLLLKQVAQLQSEMDALKAEVELVKAKKVSSSPAPGAGGVVSAAGLKKLIDAMAALEDEKVKLLVVVAKNKRLDAQLKKTGGQLIQMQTFMAQLDKKNNELLSANSGLKAKVTKAEKSVVRANRRVENDGSSEAEAWARVTGDSGGGGGSGGNIVMVMSIFAVVALAVMGIVWKMLSLGEGGGRGGGEVKRFAFKNNAAN